MVKFRVFAEEKCLAFSFFLFELAFFLLYIENLLFRVFCYECFLHKTGALRAGDRRGDGDVHGDPGRPQPGNSHPAPSGVHSDSQQDTH
jgi:hypothetical protein